MAIVVGHETMPGTHRFSRSAKMTRWTLGMRVHGRVKQAQSGQERVIEPYGVTFTRPFVGYVIGGVEPHESFEEYYAMFDPRPGWAAWMNWPEAMPGTAIIALEDRGLRKQVEGALREAFGFHRGQWGGGRVVAHDQKWLDEMAMNALERVVMLCGLLGGGHRPALDPRVARAVELARSDYRRKISLADLAKHASLSVSQLSHLFAKQVGESPSAFIEAQRMQRAQELLVATNMLVGEVAREVGYDSQYHFSKRFLARVGRSPRAFRRDAGGA
jgi:AraC family transcriptional regulator of arabinose operon